MGRSRPAFEIDFRAKSTRGATLGKCTFLAVALALSAAVPARAALVTVDFDDLSGMDFFSGAPVPSASVLTDYYLPLGVVFSNTAVVEFGAGHAVTGKNGIGGISAANTLTYSSHGQQIEFAFFVGVQAAVTDSVSIQGDLGGGGKDATLSAYDVFGNFLGSTKVSDTGGQVYKLDLPGIHLVKWSGVDINDDEGGGIGLDHLVFEQPLAVASLPEPASFWIAAVGLALATTTFRNRRQVGAA